MLWSVSTSTVLCVLFLVPLHTQHTEPMTMTCRPCCPPLLCTTDRRRQLLQPLRLQQQPCHNLLQEYHPHQQATLAESTSAQLPWPCCLASCRAISTGLNETPSDVPLGSTQLSGTPFGVLPFMYDVLPWILLAKHITWLQR